MLGVLSHLEVLASGESLRDWQVVIDQARRDSRIIAGAPFVNGQAMITRDSAVRGVWVRGIEPSLEPTVAEFASRAVTGSLDALRPGEFGVAIGRELASQWLLGLGDKLTLIAPQATATPAGMVPRLRQFTVVAIFDSGHYEYDASLLLTHLRDAAVLFRVDGVSGVRLRTTDMMNAPVIARDLGMQLPGRPLVRDWTAENRNWFAAVQIEKRMMFIILTLIIAVAAFNLVSMLVMTVTDKQSDIAILRTLGASPRSIMAVFMVQGASVGLLGTFVGLILGVVVALNVGDVVAAIEQAAGLQVLPKGVYFIDYLPSDLHWGDVLRIGLTACVLALVATIYPSWRAARVRPAEALRYE